ncbi:hypothetical protein [Altererythrobacter aquiaggeris]|uniref:hypothetical protein n=1 Tax=Aestuarierythrobacter aquiaggeris TaxID=1898396 RepID=UPI003017A071
MSLAAALILATGPIVADDAQPSPTAAAQARVQILRAEAIRFSEAGRSPGERIKVRTSAEGTILIEFL